MTSSTDSKPTAAAVAALAICEALLLALSDLKIMNAKQLRDVVDDATAAHRDADPTQDPAGRREVVAILKRIKSSVTVLAPYLNGSATLHVAPITSQRQRAAR